MKDFWSSIEEYGEKCALVDGEEFLTYSQIISKADELNKVMISRTVAFLFAENNQESVIGYLAMLRKKVVPIMMNSNIDNLMNKTLLETYCPQYIWVNADIKVPSRYSCIYNYREYCLYQSESQNQYPIAEELGLLLTTSGSTGSPKLVRQSYINLISNANAISEYLNITDNDIPITTLPMYYTYGLSIINSHFLCGAKIILNQTNIMNRGFWDKIEKYKVTTFGGVPFIYETLLKLKLENLNISSIKVLTQAGGKLSKEICEKYLDFCQKKEIKFIVMYGQTEATARMSYLPWEDMKKKCGSIGFAIPGGHFKLMDEQQNEISHSNVTGELLYVGANVTLGYALNKEDLNKEDEWQGKLLTGDMAKRDEDGYYYIVGRKKRFLKIYGSRVNLDELEGLLSRKGTEVACTGKDDMLEVYVTNMKDIDKIRAFLEKYMKINQKAINVKYIEMLPRNDSGKLLYSKLM